MDSTAEQEYAKGDSDNRNRAMSPKLGSKEGTNRGGTRGASDDVYSDGQTPKTGAAFYGSPDGRNDVGGRKDTEVKQPTKPTL